MSGLPWYPLYAGDFERDTRDLTPSEVGSYLRLLNHQYSTDREIPDEKTAFRIAGAENKKEKEEIKRILVRFFIQNSEGFYNKKAQRIIKEQKEKTNRNAENGRKGGLKKSSNARNSLLANTKQNASIPEPEPEPDIYINNLNSSFNDENPSKTCEGTRRENRQPQKPKQDEAEFENWYLTYPNKKGKGQARTAYWRARTKADAQTLLDGVAKYAKNKPQYADWKYPATWLNGECWLDEAAGEVKPRTKADQVRDAWNSKRELRHILAGLWSSNELKPVNPALVEVDIDKAHSLMTPQGDAFPLAQWTII